MADHRKIPHDGSVVLVCQGGRRSTRAACMLRDKGYDHIQVLKGGMVAWESANMLEAIDEE
jgi:rhodanese-related sulfurtransferase